MALPPDDFYRLAVASADGEHRLPLARMTGWDISPFEPDGLRVAPLRPPVLPESARPAKIRRTAVHAAPGTKGSGSMTLGGLAGSRTPVCLWC